MSLLCAVAVFSVKPLNLFLTKFIYFGFILKINPYFGKNPYKCAQKFCNNRLQRYDIIRVKNRPCGSLRFIKQIPEESGLQKYSIFETYSVQTTNVIFSKSAPTSIFGQYTYKGSSNDFEKFESPLILTKNSQIVLCIKKYSKITTASYAYRYKAMLHTYLTLFRCLFNFIP